MRWEEKQFANEDELERYIALLIKNENAQRHIDDPDYVNGWESSEQWDECYENGAPTFKNILNPRELKAWAFNDISTNVASAASSLFNSLIYETKSKSRN